MKITNIEAEMFLQTLTTLVSQELPRKAGVAIARNIRKLNEELKEYHEQKDNLIRQYGTQDGDQISLDINNREAFAQFLAGLEPINKLEFEIDIMKITYDDLPDIITPETILKLELMLED
jgi:hypothetical protein